MAITQSPGSSQGALGTSLSLENIRPRKFKGHSGENPDLGNAESINTMFFKVSQLEENI